MPMHVSCELKEESALSGGGEEGRQHEGQRPPSDRLINRALGCMQLTLGMTLVEGGGGVRSMGSCVQCKEGLARLRMNRFEILKWEKKPDSRKIRLPAPTVVYL